MVITCPECGKSFNKDLFPLGNLVNCPYCETQFRIEPARDGGAKPAPAPESPKPRGIAEEKRASGGRPEESDAVREEESREAECEPDCRSCLDSECDSDDDDDREDEGESRGAEVKVSIIRGKSGSPWPAFFIHLGIFSLIGFGLATLNWLTSPGVPWSLGAICPWGAAVLIHFWASLISGLKPGRTHAACCGKDRPAPAKRGPMIGFLDSFGSYVAVNGFLFFVDYFTDHRITWAFWVAGIWGIFTAIHLWTALIRSACGKGESSEELVAARRDSMRRKWFGFIGHFGVYAIVNSALLALNLSLTPGYLWCLWVAAAWGIGIVSGFWGGLVSSVDYLIVERRLAGARAAQGGSSLVPVVLMNLSMWAAFALAGFAVPALGAEPAVFPAPVPGIAQEIGGFSSEFPVVYWGAAILVSILAFTAFAWGSPGRKRLMNVAFYLASTLFLGAAAVMAAMVTSGLVSLQV